MTSVLITKLEIHNPPVVRANGTKIIAAFEFTAAGIRICHNKLVVNAGGYIVVWYPSVSETGKMASRSVLIDDKALHRDITAAARAAYAAMGGTLLPYTEPAEPQFVPASDPASDDEPADLPAFLTTRTPLPAGVDLDG